MDLFSKYPHTGLVALGSCSTATLTGKFLAGGPYRKASCGYALMHSKKQWLKWTSIIYLKKHWIKWTLFQNKPSKVLDKMDKFKIYLKKHGIKLTFKVYI